MATYKLNVSGRGAFLVPHKNARMSFLNSQSLTTNGRGLLEAKTAVNDHHIMTSGCGVGVKETSRVAGAVGPNLSGLKSRLASMKIGGRGVGAKGGKKAYISLKA